MNKIFKHDKSDYYISSKISPNGETTAREVTQYEIEFYTTSTNISVINGKEYPQKKGNVLVAVPGDIRYSINSFECYYAHFNCDDSEISDRIKAMPKVFEPRDGDLVAEVFKRLIQPSGEDKISKKLCTQGRLMELLGVLSSEGEGKYSGKYMGYFEDIERACTYMEGCFEQQLTLADIADTVNLSAGFFHKVFKTIKGCSPSNYLTDVRMRNAKDLLKRSNLPLAEIAVRCGFNSQAYFNYVFLKNTSVTPKSYRDKNRVII